MTLKERVLGEWKASVVGILAILVGIGYLFLTTDPNPEIAIFLFSTGFLGVLSKNGLLNKLIK